MRILIYGTNIRDGGRTNYQHLPQGGEGTHQGDKSLIRIHQILITSFKTENLVCYYNSLANTYGIRIYLVTNKLSASKT